MSCTMRDGNFIQHKKIEVRERAREKRAKERSENKPKDTSKVDIIDVTRFRFTVTRKQILLDVLSVVLLFLLPLVGLCYTHFRFFLVSSRHAFCFQKIFNKKCTRSITVTLPCTNQSTNQPYHSSSNHVGDDPYNPG